MPALRDRQVPNEDVKPNLPALDPIAINATCLLLELFLSMLPESTREFVLNALTFEQCRDLLNFTEQYECVKLVPRIRTYLIHKTTGRGKATALFLFASDRDDWPLGRDAMKKMDAEEVRLIFGTGNRGKSDADMKVRVFFNKLSVDWQQVLMPLLVFGACSSGIKLSQLEWPDFADKFVKPVKSAKRKAWYVILLSASESGSPHPVTERLLAPRRYEGDEGLIELDRALISDAGKKLGVCYQGG
jgi:hypothetical protein